jgi:hypothetical protein
MDENSSFVILVILVLFGLIVDDYGNYENGIKK